MTLGFEKLDSRTQRMLTPEEVAAKPKAPAKSAKTDKEEGEGQPLSQASDIFENVQLMVEQIVSHWGAERFGAKQEPLGERER